MKILNTTLVILLTFCNIFRYLLPTYIDTISLFDTLTLVSLMIACIIGIIPKKNVFIEGLLIYNILGCLDSIADELFFDPTLNTSSEWKNNIGIIIFCIGFMIYRVKARGKSLL